MTNVACLLQYFLLLCQHPVDIILLTTYDTPDYLMQTVVNVASTSSHPLQIINVKKWHPLVTRCQIVTHRLLFVLIYDSYENSTVAMNYLLDYVEMEVPVFYTYNFLFLLSGTVAISQWNFEMHLDKMQHIIAIPDWIGMSIVAVCGPKEHANVEPIMTRDLRIWLPMYTFFRHFSDPRSVELWSTPSDQRMLRLCASMRSVPIKRMHYLYDVANADLEDIRLNSLLGQHFQACSAMVTPLAKGFLWTRGGKHQCNAAVAMNNAHPQILENVNGNMVWTGVASRIHIENVPDAQQICFGNRRLAMLVPNWWHLSLQLVIENRKRQSVMLLSITGILFVVLVLVRRWQASATFAKILFDTFARLLSISVHGHRFDRPAARILAAVATVWGMLNGIAMTGLLFDLSVNSASWRPVFGQWSDVRDHAWLPLDIGKPMKNSFIWILRNQHHDKM